MIQYYCIPTCDKCRKARKGLQEKRIEHREVNMRKEGLSAETLQNWVMKFGLDTILNRRSTTWHALSEDQHSQINSEYVRMMIDNPTLLNRPILDFGDHLLLGKEALEWIEAQPAQ